MEDHHHHPLRGAREKVRWADEHIGALDKEVAAWMDKHDNLVAGEFYAEAQVAALRVHAPDPPPRWGVMTGNIVHCARSALDYLIWQLVEHHGVKKPKAGPGGNQFPIIDTAPPAGFAKNTKGWLQGVHPDHRAIIEWFQPYERTGDIPVTDNPLTLLNKLSNTDKHQLLQTPKIWVAQQEIPMPFEFQLSIGPDAPTHLTVPPNPQIVPVRDIQEMVAWGHFLDGSLENGAICAWAQVVPSGPDPQMKMDGEIGLSVAFDDGRNVPRTVKNLLVTTAAILEVFWPVFEGKDTLPMPSMQIVHKGPPGT